MNPAQESTVPVSPERGAKNIHEGQPILESGKQQPLNVLPPPEQGEKQTDSGIPIDTPDWFPGLA
jgi:hypothetical protein